MSTALKFATPLIVAMALVGCNKKTETTTTASAPTTTTTASAPATTVTASANGATATATVSTTTTSTTAVDPNMTPEDHKKARERIMKEWKKTSQTIGAMVKDPSKFDAAQVKAAAEKLNQNPWVHYPETAKGGEAKDEIWRDAAGFQQQIDKFKTAASALNAAAATATSVDGIKTQFGDLGASCKSCHDKYKQD